MINDEIEDDLDFSIEFHSDNKDCIACVHWQTDRKECIACGKDDRHCDFEQNTELQIMKNITNFNAGFY